MTETEKSSKLALLDRISTCGMMATLVVFTLLYVLHGSGLMENLFAEVAIFCGLGASLIWGLSAQCLFFGALFRRRWGMLAWAATQILIFVFGMSLFFPINTAPQASMRMENNNYIKQLNFALRNYAEAHDGQLPPHRVGTEPDENGIYPHSWRVYILPFVEENGLFKKIRLNEPWDSEWNRQFHEKMPSFFKNPFCRGSLSKSETTYGVLIGDGMVFPENGDGRKITELRPDLAWIAETTPGCWMDPNHDVREIRKYAKSEIQYFGCVDTKIRFTSKPVTLEELKTMVWEE